MAGAVSNKPRFEIQRNQYGTKAGRVKSDSNSVFDVPSNLDQLVNLEILDVSHNRVRKIEGFGCDHI